MGVKGRFGPHKWLHLSESVFEKRESWEIDNETKGEFGVLSE